MYRETPVTLKQYPTQQWPLEKINFIDGNMEIIDQLITRKRMH